MRNTKHLDATALQKDLLHLLKDENIKITFEADKSDKTTDIETNEDDRTPQPTEELYYYHPDHLGTATFLTDYIGNPYQFFLNLPFGETMAEQRSYTDNFNNRWKFNGKELDEETGLYYYGARFYNPSTSLWLSVDPLAEKFPAWSPYNYTMNNPVNMVDPDGRAPLDWYQSNKTGSIIWREGSANIKGYTNIGTYTDVAAGTGQNWHLNSNGTFRNSNTGKSYGNNETVVFNSSTGQTLTSKQNWVQRNLVIELSLSGSVGAQVGGKIGPVEGSAGLMTTDVGTATFDFTSLNFNKSAWGDGSIHNYAEAMVGIKKTQLALGGKIDQSYSSLGAMSGNGLTTNGTFNSKFSSDLDFAPNLMKSHEGLNIQPSAAHSDNFRGFQLGVGAKVFFGVELNLKLGIKE